MCARKRSFDIFELGEEIIYKENLTTVQVLDKGTVDVMLSFGKIFTLNDVYVVPKINENPYFIDFT